MIEPPRIMAGEDFSAYQRQVPGVFFGVGVRNEDVGSTYPHHHPRFTIDEAALPHGIAVFLQTVFDLNGV